MKYIKVDDLQKYCDHQIDHSITPNEFQRMNHLEIIQCKDCDHHGYCNVEDLHNSLDFFCADGKKRTEHKKPYFI